LIGLLVDWLINERYINKVDFPHILST